MNRKKLLLTMAAALCLGALTLPMGCKSSRLETGGAYAPLVTNVVSGLPVVSTNADLTLYQCDAAFDLAHSALDTAFTLERNNRALLWKVSPTIKHTLDVVRPQAEDATVRYAAGRKAYMAAPTPQTADLLSSIATELSKLAAAAAAATSVTVTNK